MTNKEKKKFQKKKEREREVRKRVLYRRDALQTAREEQQAKEDQLEKEYQGTKKPMPIVNDPAKKDEMIKKRLEENMKILEALEQEYIKETEGRKQSGGCSFSADVIRAADKIKNTEEKT